MELSLLELDFSRWEIILLSLVPALINVCIYIYASFFIPASKTNSSFSFFVLLIAIWQTAEAFTKLSTTAGCAYEWARISELFLVLLIPQGIKFTFYLTHYHKKTWINLLSISMFLSAFLMAILIVARQDKYTIIESHFWYWISNPEPTLVSSILLSWICFGALLMLVCLWISFFNKNKDSIERKQSFIIVMGILIPVIAGIILEAILPILLKIDDVPLTAPLMTIFSVASFIGIKKYKLLQYSPKHQWSSIIESMSDSLVIADIENRIVFANNRFCEILGYEFKDIDGMNAGTFYSANEKVKQKIENIYIGKQKSQFEAQLKSKNGENRWMIVSYSPYIDIKGKIIGSILVFTDITEVKEANETIKHGEKRLKQSQQVAHLGSWELSFNSDKTIWSEEACRIYGLPIDESEQSFESWLSFIHPEDLELVKGELEKTRRELKDSSFKHKVISRDGKIKHIHSVSKIEFNDAGFPVGLFGICHDVTAQEETKTALTETELRLKRFIDESLLSIYFLDPSTKKIVYANKAFSTLIGYTMEELKSMTLYDFIDHSKENIDSRIEEVMKEKKIENGERNWKRKNGEIINVLVSSVYQNGNTGTIFIAAQDITERKKAEERLKAINSELAMYIYRSSHDLRGPLASIVGLINICKKEITDQDSLKYFEMIGSAANKLDETLVYLVRAMQLGDAKVAMEEIKPETLVTDILAKYKFMDEFSTLKINMQIDSSLKFISDRFLIENIFQNLIENGIKYRNIRSGDSFLNINVLSKNGNIEITVEDNGIGIDESIQSRVFEMFFKGTINSKGSGLGLYLVQKAVSKLHGNITLKSKPDEGTAFVISLPQTNPN